MRRMTFLYVTLLVALAMTVAGTAAFGQWTVGVYDLPSDIAWDTGDDSSVRIVYTGGGLAAGQWAMVPVEGSTAPVTVVDRWGRLHTDPNSVAFTHGYTYDYDFSITGPALTTLQYTAPVGLTAPGLPLTVDCNWVVASPYTPTATVVAKLQRTLDVVGSTLKEHLGPIAAAPVVDGLLNELVGLWDE